MWASGAKWRAARRAQEDSGAAGGPVRRHNGALPKRTGNGVRKKANKAAETANSGFWNPAAVSTLVGAAKERLRSRGPAHARKRQGSSGGTRGYQSSFRLSASVQPENLNQFISRLRNSRRFSYLMTKDTCIILSRVSSSVRYGA